MNPHDFVPAIREDPEDDTPRLVCADWFEEHGQLDRAEFIRAQIELARPETQDDRRRQLRQRTRELLATHEEEWASELLSLVSAVGFRRGFIERVTLTVPEFLDNAEQLLALAPIREAVFVKTGPELQQLADCPHLANLTLLDFRDSTFDEEDLPVLFASPHLGQLRSFVLRLRGLGEAVIDALVWAPQPPPLTTLDLYDARVNAQAIDALAAWPGAARLEALILGGSDIGEGGALSLSRSSRLTRLRTLHLAFAHLGDDDALGFAEAPHLATLEKLDLRHNDFSEETPDRLRARFGSRVYL